MTSINPFFKIYFLTSLFLCCFIFKTTAQNTLEVKKKSGVNLTSISVIDSIIFYDKNELLKPSDQPWKSVSGFDSSAVAAYNKYFLGGWGSLISIQRLNQVCLSDYFRWLGNEEGISIANSYNRTLQEVNPDLESYYYSLFANIKLCNAGLTFIDKNYGDPFPNASIDEKTNNITRIQGELYFMRAYCYYYLATNFCPSYNDINYMTYVPLKLFIPKTISQYWSENTTHKSTNDIYNQIVADLKKAKMYLPKAPTTGMNSAYGNRGRANYFTATAFLAQVYFTMGKFTGSESALTELDDVINNGGYALASNPFDCFNNNSITIDNTTPGVNEVIFWAFYADNSSSLHSSLRFTQFNKCARDARNGGNGNTSTGTSPKWSNFHSWLQLVLAKSALVEMGWMNADGTEPIAATNDKRYWNNKTPILAGYRNEMGLFYRYEGAYADTTAYRIAKGIRQLGRRTGASDDGKYIISSKYATLIGQNEPVVLLNKYYRAIDGKKQNIPVIRLAELYLNRAIIKKRFGMSGYASDYNMVARRAWNESLSGVPYIDKSDSEVTERMILIERWKELAGEDDWYLPYCQALGYEVGKGDRINVDSNLKLPYTNAFFKVPSFENKGSIFIFGKNGIQTNLLSQVDTVKIVDLPVVSDIDGNSYRTAVVNGNTWMIDNLRTTRYRNGDLIPNLVDSTAWVTTTQGAQCTNQYTSNNDSIQMYGRLYNSYAVSDLRNLAPVGWHIATSEEWMSLSNSQLGDYKRYPIRLLTYYRNPFIFSNSFWSISNYIVNGTLTSDYSYNEPANSSNLNWALPVRCIKDK